MCWLHEMVWFYPAMSETSKLQKQRNWEGKGGLRLCVGGHEHGEREQRFIDWLGGGITTSSPVEGGWKGWGRVMQGLGEFWSPSPGIWSWQEPSGNRNIRQSWSETGWELPPIGNVRGPEIKGWMQKLSADGASRGQQGIFQRNPLKFKKCVFVGRENEHSMNNYVWLLLTTSPTMNHPSLLSVFYFSLS